MRKLLEGYRIFREEITSSGKLYYASRWGMKCVVKEYAGYRFPEPGEIGENTSHLVDAELRAQAFYTHLKRLSRTAWKAFRINGLFNFPLDVFRQGPFLYKVTRMLNSCGEDISHLYQKLTRRQMDVLLKTVLMQFSALEKLSYVHGDFKPDNMVIQKKGMAYSAAVIDYETGFFCNENWNGLKVDYTPEYASPEMLIFQSLLKADSSDTMQIQCAFRQMGCATDVFSAACVFAYFLTGHALGWNSETETWLSASERLVMEVPLWIPMVHPVWRFALQEMLCVSPQARPTARDILEMLRLADTIGLMGKLENPFRFCHEYQFEPLSSWIELPLEDLRVRVGRRAEDRGRKLVWNEGQIWTLLRAKRPSQRRTDLLEKQRIAYERRKENLRLLQAKLHTLSKRSPTAPQFCTVEYSGLYFVVQDFPEGKWMTLEEFAASGPSSDTVLHIMRELLEITDSLHREGILSCALAKDDIWIVTDSRGIVSPFFARPQRLVLEDRIPPCEDICTPADLMAPEMCIYMGTHEKDRRENIVKSIGPWSDMFSLGLVYHLLQCGKWPKLRYFQDSYFGFAVQNKDGIVLDSALNGRQKAIIHRMTAFEPNDRVGNCSEAVSLLFDSIPIRNVTVPTKPLSGWHPLPVHHFQKFVFISENDESLPFDKTTEELEIALDGDY